MAVEEKFKELDIVLPEASAPVGAYVPYVQSGNLLFISGQLPVLDGKLQHKGKVGSDMSIESGKEAAKLCFLNAVAQAKAALGNLDRIKRIVQLSGFVASAKDFTDQPLVMNGASECAVQAFGEAGKHSRLALGVAELPMGAVVEVGVIFEIY